MKQLRLLSTILSSFAAHYFDFDTTTALDFYPRPFFFQKKLVKSFYLSDKRPRLALSKSNNMTLQFKVKILDGRILVKDSNFQNSPIGDVYYVNQGSDGRFYLTSDSGYNEFDGGKGTKSLEMAIYNAKKRLQMDHDDYEREIRLKAKNI